MRQLLAGRLALVLVLVGGCWCGWPAPWRAPTCRPTAVATPDPTRLVPGPLATFTPAP
ncbi:MAG: hypothetical protein KKA73_14920 [Chloroflexi bacterium]|nr:hypothetical protein [Chloroflexota bacterium]